MPFAFFLWILAGRQYLDSPSLHLDPAFAIQPDSSHIQPVLQMQNAFRKGRHRVVILDRHGFLQNDRPGVHPFVHEMNRGARNFHAVNQSLFLCVQPRK